MAGAWSFEDLSNDNFSEVFRAKFGPASKASRDGAEKVLMTEDFFG